MSDKRATFKSGMHVWRVPKLRTLSTIGGDLTTYSASLGSLETVSPYGGGGLLRSSIARPVSFTRRRSLAPASTLTTQLPTVSTPTGHTTKVPPLAMPRPSVHSKGVSVLEGIDPGRMAAMAQYLQLVGQGSQLLPVLGIAQHR